MLNCPVRFVVMTLLAVLFIAGQSEAGRSRLSKPSERTFDVRQTRFLVGAKFNAGIVVGDAANLVDSLNGGLSEKLTYGFGLTADYYITPATAIGLSAEYGWKTAPVSTMKSIHHYSIATGFMYRFSPLGRSSLFLRPEIGITKFKYPDFNDSDLGSHTHVRFGIGQVYATGPVTAARFELYYKHIFTEGHQLSEVPFVPWDEVPFDVIWIGLDITFMLGI